MFTAYYNFYKYNIVYNILSCFARERSEWMGSIIKACLLFIIVLPIFFGHLVKATSWIELEPKEVIKRSTVVVQGKYDFSSPTERSGKMIWSFYDFRVEQVFKGNVSDIIIVGIDYYDMGWVDELQKSSSMLLFLEPIGDDGYLFPVGGPNGMLSINNGEIQLLNERHRRVFENFINKNNLRKPGVNIKNIIKPIYLKSIVFFISMLGFIVYKSVKKKINSNKVV
jgi:hypothetical protein